ncbi:MAG TPA: TetR/AcrR family transcriptional regulator [Caulobacteraceae bacterium]|jgi:AcrR family transcriptional regulator
MSISVQSYPVPNETQRPNRRAESKARTRQKVLDAAKRLFMARGYEGATMRDMAAEAGLSTGALFANFTDKADLFNEVMLADFEVQHERMREVLEDANGKVEERLVALLSAGYDFHLSQLPLLQAGISVSWSQGLNGELGERPAWRTVLGFLTEILEQGVAKKELKKDFDRELLAEVLWDCYLANYRRALFAEWGLEQLKERLREQVRLILRAVKV